MKEQKILYFDIINGISGDMTLATLLDLGVPKQIFLEELDKLNLGKEFKIEITDKFENGIKGTNVNVVVNEGHVHRNLIDIYDIIDKSTLNDKIKQNAKDIFMEVAKVEAKVHGTSIDKIHFHEVGAMDSISINENNGLIEIYVEGNGFLYNMVRIIAGTLIDAGHNKITPEEVKNLLELKDRSKSPETAPSKGLFLYRVKY